MDQSNNCLSSAFSVGLLASNANPDIHMIIILIAILPTIQSLPHFISQASLSHYQSVFYYRSSTVEIHDNRTFIHFMSVDNNNSEESASLEQLNVLHAGTMCAADTLQCHNVC